MRRHGGRPGVVGFGTLAVKHFSSLEQFLPMRQDKT